MGRKKGSKDKVKRIRRTKAQIEAAKISVETKVETPEVETPEVESKPAE